jgi:hypothetical protein
VEVLTQRLDKRRSLGFAEEGLTCAELVEGFAPAGIDREYVLCAINGVPVPRHLWAHVTPKEHAQVIVAIVPGKGGGKKNPLALIASIAIAIVAPMAAGAILGASGGTVLAFGITAQAALGTAIGFVANMALGAIFKPSQPSISAASASTSSSSSSPTYSLQGQSNLLDPYGPVRRIFGTHRIYPVIAGRPYSEISGDDQYLTTLYDIGAGDYEVSDVRIGASHIGYFQNASYYVHRNTKTPGLLWYWGARHEDAYSLILNDGWSTVDTQPDTAYFVATFVFPTGLASINRDTGAQGQNIARFQIEWSPYGSGAWYPLQSAHYWHSSRNIMPATDSANVEVTGGELLRQEGSWGNPDDGGDGDLRAMRLTSTTTGYPPGAQVLELRSQSVPMPYGSTFIYNGTTYTILGNVTTSAQTHNISPPLQTEFVTQVTHYEGEGEWLQYDPPQTVLAYHTATNTYEIRDSRIQQLALSVTVRPIAGHVEGQRFSIRARQTQGAGDEQFTYGDMIFAGVSSISGTVPAINLRNEHTLLELRVKANDQVNGTLEDLSCFAQSYLWVRRAGAWSYELSRNPAWCLWEVLTGKMNKRPVSQAKLDLASFEAWANYCDSIHPSTGDARARFDHVVDYYTTLFALAQTVSAAGRATLAPGDGLFRVIIDEPKTTPVQVFTPHNSIGFKGTRTFIEAPHAFRAKFMNSASWKVEEFTVYNDGYSLGNSSVFEVIELPGVTREGQVWCDARYRMAQGIHRQESWTLEVDWENLICTRGDLVHVAHDVPKLGGLPARIKDVHYTGGGLADQWTLTEPVDFGGNPGGFGYTIRSVNGVIQQGQFGAQLDAYTVAPLVPIGNVQIGDLHVWGEMDHITYPFLVAAIAPQSDAAATLTLVPYAGAAIFGADQGAIPPYDPVVDDDLSLIAPPPIPRVTILQTLVYAARRPLLTISFDWRQYVAPIFVNYEIWLDWDLNTTGAPVLLGRSASPNFEWMHAIDVATMRHYVGTRFCVRVLGVNSFGAKRTLSETPATCDTIIGDTTKPAPPPYLDLDLKRDTITLNWDHPAAPDVDYYEVRYSPLIEDASYAQSTVLAPQIAYPTRSMDVPTRLGTYFIKCVDTSGNRSDGFAAAFTPGENIWQLNVVATWDDKPEGWPGSKGNFEVAGGNLRTIALSEGVYHSRAEYYYDQLYDGGAIYQTRFTSKIVAGGVSFNSIMARWVPLASAAPIAGSVVLDTGDGSNIAELIDVWHEIRWVTVANVMADWTPLASAVPIGFGESDFGPWRRFQVGDYIGQVFQFRLIAEYIGPDAVADVGASIVGAVVEIDMTDRVDGVYDVACPVGGMRVIYEPAFKERPAIAITSDSVSVGDGHVITNSDRNGFDIEFLNGGASVARQFDWLAKGYGAQSTRIVEGMIRRRSGPRRQPVARVHTRRAA